MNAMERAHQMTTSEIITVWTLLGKGYDNTEPGPHGCSTMDEWAEVIYNELYNRRLTLQVTEHNRHLLINHNKRMR